MALDKDALKNELVALIITNDASLKQEQIDKMTEVFDKIAIAVTNQIATGQITVTGDGTYNIS